MVIISTWLSTIGQIELFELCARAPSLRLIFWSAACMTSSQAASWGCCAHPISTSTYKRWCQVYVTPFSHATLQQLFAGTAVAELLKKGSFLCACVAGVSPWPSSMMQQTHPSEPAPISPWGMPYFACAAAPFGGNFCAHITSNGSSCTACPDTFKFFSRPGMLTLVATIVHHCCSTQLM